MALFMVCLCMGRYGCVGGPTRDNMGSHEWVVRGLKSRAASARVNKHFVTIFSKTCDIISVYWIYFSLFKSIL